MRQLLGLLRGHLQLLLIILLRNIQKMSKKRVHRDWVHPILRKRETFREGMGLGLFSSKMREHKVDKSPKKLLTK